MFTKRIFLASTIVAVMAVLVIAVSARNREDGAYPSLGLFHTLVPLTPASASGFIPISVCSSCLTSPFGVNERGLISGQYFDAGFTSHGFVKNGDSYITIDPPDTFFTECGRTNNPGYTTCDYADADLGGIVHPFVRNPDGSLSIRPGFPGAVITFAVGINQRGDIIGSHTDDPTGSTGWQGYVMRGNDFILAVNYPGATSTFALDMTEGGTIVGAFKTTTAGEEHGFMRTPDGQYTQIDVPGSIQTETYGINNSEDIVGRYRDTDGVDHGYLMRHGRVTTIDYVGPETYVWGVNSSGTVVGFSTDSPFGLSTGGFELPRARGK